jgi:hypothetical protein
VLGDPGIRLMLTLFACLWLPMVLSLPDAVNFPRALSTTASFLRFPLAGIFIIQTLRAAQTFERLWLGLVWVIGFFCADALFQLIIGFDLFGRPHDGVRLNGVFSKLTLGTVLAVTAPVYIVSLDAGRGGGACPVELASCAVRQLLGVLQLVDAAARACGLGAGFRTSAQCGVNRRLCPWPGA